MYEAHSTETVCTYQSYLTCAEGHPLIPEYLHPVVLLLKLHHGITQLHVGWMEEHLRETVVFLRIGPCVNRCRELCWHRNWPTWHLFPQMYGVTCMVSHALQQYQQNHPFISMPHLRTALSNDHCLEVSHFSPAVLDEVSMPIVMAMNLVARKELYHNFFICMHVRIPGIFCQQQYTSRGPPPQHKCPT